MIVDIFFKELTCDRTTREAGAGPWRDEVFIEVIGSTPSGNISARLPRSHYKDDYYGFFSGGQVSRAGDYFKWENQDGALMHEPWIWSGNLNNGQSADFTIIIAEQDNVQAAIMANGIRAGIEKAAQSAGNDPIARGVAAAALEIINQMGAYPAGDLIGAFHIRATNVNDRINVTWLPLKNVPFRGGNSNTTFLNSNDHYANALKASGSLVQSFIFNGTPSGRYRGIVEVKLRRTGEPKKAHRYLITEFDACSPANMLTIFDFDPYKHPRPFREVQRLARGEAKSFDVSMPTWWWRCGDNNRLDTTRAARHDIRNVIARRHTSTGQIKWYCFAKEDW